MTSKNKKPIKVCLIAIFIIFIMSLIVFLLVFYIGCYTKEERYTTLLVTIEPDNDGEYEVIIPIIIQIDSNKPLFENSSLFYKEGDFKLYYVTTHYGVGLKINGSGPVNLRYSTKMNINIGYSLGVNSSIYSINNSSESKCWIYFYSDKVNEISLSYNCYNSGSKRTYSCVGNVIEIADYGSNLNIEINEKLNIIDWNQYNVTIEKRF